MLMIFFYCLFILPQTSCSQSGNKTVSVDGKKFAVLCMEKSNPSSAEYENITFSNGMFDNEGCHIWGFADGKYTAHKQGENIQFEATTNSAKEGSMIWKGTITGDKILGDMIWRKEGQEDIQYTFGNMDLKMASLDGKSFVCTTMQGDSSVTEEVSFNNGKFESPACYQWGFSAAPYNAWQSGSNIMWQSLYNSDKEGWMLFRGTIADGNYQATSYWRKEGQEDQTDTYIGMLK